MKAGRATAWESAKQQAQQLNHRQKIYLAAVYEREQAGEGPPRATGLRRPWMEYGSNMANSYEPNLRMELRRRNLVDEGTGATFAALKERGLLQTERIYIGLYRGRVSWSLFVRLTAAGRNVARVLREEPKPERKPKEIKPLSLTALRLIKHGQEHPGKEFDVWAPWEQAAGSPDYLVLLGVSKGLIKRGLLDGAPPDSLRITELGKTIQVTAEPSWRELRRI